MSSRYTTWLIILLTLVIGACGVWFSQLPASRNALLPAKKVTVSPCDGVKALDGECWKKYYHDLTVTEGVAAAFVSLKQNYQTNSTIVTDCHPLTHIIGRAAGDVYGDVGKAYEAGDNFCASGYYHGVMESIAGKIGLKDLPGKVSSICTSVATPKYSLKHFNCVHGLGHGFMAVEGDELFTSLDLCDKLNDNWEVLSCDGGVFMENVMTSFNSAYHHSNYLKADDLLYPCSAVSVNRRDPCYLIQSSYALQQLGFDFAKTFAVCATVPEANFRATCYQSIGRDASGNANSQGDGAYTNCSKGNGLEQLSNCAIGAVKDIVWHNLGTKEGFAFCDKFDSSISVTCKQIAEGYYKSF